MEIPWWKFEFPGNKFLPWILRPLRTEVRAVLWTYRTVQSWAGNLTLWNAARFFRCQKPDLKPQSIDGSESFPSNRGSSYCFHGGTLKIIQSSWMTMTMTLYWKLWWRLGIPWKPCLSARGSTVLQECQPLRVDPDAMLWEWVLFKHQKHIQKLEQSENSSETDVAMDQYLYIPFLVGWTSIYQLFWCSPGVQGFDPLPCEEFPFIIS